MRCRKPTGTNNDNIKKSYLDISYQVDDIDAVQCLRWEAGQHGLKEGQMSIVHDTYDDGQQQFPYLFVLFQHTEEIRIILDRFDVVNAYSDGNTAVLTITYREHKQLGLHTVGCFDESAIHHEGAEKRMLQQRGSREQQST